VDHVRENSIIKWADRLTWGVDAAAGWGGFSFTGAYSAFDWSNSDIGADITGWSALVQIGFLFPDTAWEIAARASIYSGDFDGFEPAATEYGIAVNYYIDGHADKLTIDAVERRSGEGNYSPLACADSMLRCGKTKDSRMFLHGARLHRNVHAPLGAPTSEPQGSSVFTCGCV
jgi:hypothetical protein